MPNPRKLKADSNNIATDKDKDICTMIGAMLLGRRCLKRIYELSAPFERAALIYSFDFRAIIAPLLIRANWGM